MRTVWILTVINIVLGVLVWVPGAQFWEQKKQNEQDKGGGGKEQLKVYPISVQESEALIEKYNLRKVEQLGEAGSSIPKMCLLLSANDPNVLNGQGDKMLALGSLVEVKMDESKRNLRVYFEIANQEAVIKVLEKISEELKQADLTKESISWSMCQ